MGELHLFADTQVSKHVHSGAPHFPSVLTILMAVFCLVSSALAKEDNGHGEEGELLFPDRKVSFPSVRAPGPSNFLLAFAKCTNVSNGGKRAECLSDADATLREDDQLCRAQLAGRRTACQAFGESRYDPDFNPANFDDPNHPRNPNLHFPLRVGNTWEYRAQTSSPRYRC